MRISDRLKEMANAVSPGESIADIGTDHGYIPLMLYQKGISRKMILSDISEDSLNKARMNMEASHIILPPGCYRVGNGLETLEYGEVDTVIIGGLGGRTIQIILDAEPDKSRSYRKLILQPRNNSGEIRSYLYRNGWRIVREALAGEGKFICEIITAVPGSGAQCSGSYDEYDEHDIRWKYPEAFIQCDPELLEKRIGWRVGRLQEQICSLKQSASDQTDRIRIREEQENYLLELLQKNRDYHEK